MPKEMLVLEPGDRFVTLTQDGVVTPFKVRDDGEVVRS